MVAAFISMCIPVVPLVATPALTTNFFVILVVEAFAGGAGTYAAQVAFEKYCPDGIQECML